MRYIEDKIYWVWPGSQRKHLIVIRDQSNQTLCGIQHFAMMDDTVRLAVCDGTNSISHLCCNCQKIANSHTTEFLKQRVIPELSENIKSGLLEAIGSLDPARVSKAEMNAVNWFRDRMILVASLTE